jgi:phospholipid/cholesterol/gamma-HCH transport system substrate-binding protein
MTVAIRKHLRDFIAVAVLFLIALVVGWYIVQEQRLRVPVLEERPFELKAEMETAQSVIPGQGQTVRVAGVRIGDIDKVELNEGTAVVTMAIDRKFLPIYRDASILLRPKTGLKDMFLEMDPGTRAAGEYDEGDSMPVKNSLPDVNLDEILEALDDDTQAYLRMLITGGGQGLKGRARDLGKLLGSLGPLNRELAKVSTAVAERKENLARLIHNLNVLTDTVGQKDDELADLVAESNAAIGAIASQDLNVQRAVGLLPGTLRTARTTLTKVDTLADVLGPTFDGLRPFARNLKPLNDSLYELAKTTRIPIRDAIRPLVRRARKPVRILRRPLDRLTLAWPRLTDLAFRINRLGNMAAYNPGGAQPPGTPGRDEGYLYWAAWLAHNGNSVFQTQDAHGAYRRIYFTVGCDEALGILAGTPLAPLVTGLDALFGAGGPFAGGCFP